MWFRSNNYEKLYVASIPSSRTKRSRRAFLIAGGTLASLAVVGFGGGIALEHLNNLQHPSAHTPLPSLTQQPKIHHSPSSSTATTTTQPGASIILTMTDHQKLVRIVAWSPDGTTLASGADDAQLLLWSPQSGGIQQRILHPAEVLSAAWSPDSLRLMSASGNQIFFRSLAGTILARSTTVHINTINSVAWSAQQGMNAVSGGADHKAVVWNTDTYQPQAIFAKHTSAITGVSWGPEHSIASTSQGGAIRLWSSTTAQELHGFYDTKPTPLRVCAFAHDPQASLAVGGNDGLIRFWHNASTCQQQIMSTIDGLVCQDLPDRLSTSSQAVRSLAWSPDGRYLASGSNDGSFSIWNPIQQESKPLLTITIKPGAAIRSIAWSPDGKQLATASDSIITLWHLQL